VFDVEESIRATSVPPITSRVGIPPRAPAIPPVPPGPSAPPSASAASAAPSPHAPPAVAPRGQRRVAQHVSPPAAPQVRRQATRPIPWQRAEPLLEHAVRYTKERHWDVLPGTWLEFSAGIPRCSCAAHGCDAPGAHPTRPDWEGQATGSTSAARRLWTEEPHASILLPTGQTFDVIEVPEASGCLALARMERMGTALGPVSSTPYGRMMFFVLPGGAVKVPGLLRQLGWSLAAMDLRVRGEGEYVAAPPTRIGRRGSVQWVREPTTANRWLPDAEELLAPLAYACGQDGR
jgi:bifunctional DNA primase/polymerase-like protein